MSYARKDEVAIAPVRAALTTNDFCVWDPSHDLRVGDSFAKQISSAIEETARRFGFFIHFLSRASLESSRAGQELGEFLRFDIVDRYIPILLEPQSALSDLLPESVRGKQWLDYSAYNVDALMPRPLRALGVRNSELP
jgi:hypothetical protein